MSHTFTPADATPYLEPVTVGDFTLRNRVFYSPCSRNRGNIPGERQVTYYRARAKAGLIVSEGTLPIPQGYEYANAPGIYTKKQIAGWKAVTDAVHEEGGVIFCQIMHIGRVANPLFQAAQAPIGPSAVKAVGGRFRQAKYNWVTPRHEVVEMEGDYVVPEAIEDIGEVIADYRRAFENVKLAGFDGVELHCANGYLLNQFLDHTSNVRTDEYGGSAEKRCRFILEVLAVAIDVFGSAGRVAVKLSPEGSSFGDMGMPMEELLATYGYLLKQLDAQKIAFVEIQRWFSAFDSIKRGTIVPCSIWRQYYTGKLFLNGNISPAEGARLMNAGSADGILFGRYFMSNPDLVERLARALPLNGFDWNTAFSSANEGYLDLKTWDEQTEEERAETTKKYEAYLVDLTADLKLGTDLYIKQETEVGRVPETLYVL